MPQLGKANGLGKKEERREWGGRVRQVVPIGRSVSHRTWFLQLFLCSLLECGCPGKALRADAAATLPSSLDAAATLPGCVAT